MALVHQRQEVAEIVRPNDDGQDALPKTQAQVAGGKEPSREPKPAPNMMLNFNLLHLNIVYFINKPTRVIIMEVTTATTTARISPFIKNQNL